MSNPDVIVRENLSRIVDEMAAQTGIRGTYRESELSYDDEICALKEYLDVGHEYSIAYEGIVATLEKHGFTLTGRGAVRLLEVALIMRYKTERPEDAYLDLRSGR